ncbi:MAG: aminotransferase class III-fold pyridoxal phosphate-dependent enzyme [Alistipes sp.]|nr:aminotransferase class III-fold pyridoxal phosphate-dependent enzyme [Alistipes sp.]
MKILRQQFLEHVAQTSPSPLAIEIERAEGVFFYAPEGSDASREDMPGGGAPSGCTPSEDASTGDVPGGGRRYFDLVSGVSVSNVGHGNPEVVEAVRAQAASFMHTMVYGEMVLAPQVRYAARLAEVLRASCEGAAAECSGAAVSSAAAGSRGASLQSVYFVNSGAEAIEGALKLAKRAARERVSKGMDSTARREILAFRRAYHGSTHGALSLMSSPEGDEWRTPFEPLLSDVDWLTFNDFSSLSRITEATACVVVEPVQGEAGVRLPAPGFLAALRRRCDETGALLIFDEIQTGMGRTGTLFAFEQAGRLGLPGASYSGGSGAGSGCSGAGATGDSKVDGESSEAGAADGGGTVVPDILCLAKAFGGGMPLGAFIASNELMSLLSHDPALGHITTFGGHPVCCAAGLAALEFLVRDGSRAIGANGSVLSEVEAKGTGLGGSVLSKVESKGAMFEEVIGVHPAVVEIRRAGLLIAVELGNSAKMYRLMELFVARGVVSDWFLFCDTAFRISPPLTITEAEIRECCQIIVGCLDEIES